MHASACMCRAVDDMHLLAHARITLVIVLISDDIM